MYAAYRFGGYDEEESGYLAGMSREDGVDGGFDITRQVIASHVVGAGPNGVSFRAP
mgnify:CR=1 FL=1